MSQPKEGAPASTSHDLVRVGPRHVSAKQRQGRRNEDGQKPTTARALVLRNGKQGAMGTGEMVLAKKMSGREKLDLLAEDQLEQAKTAVMAPFKLEELQKIAESEYNEYLDDILNIQESDTFFSTIQAELNARKPANYKKDPLRDQALVLRALGTRVHNSFMLASAWRIIREYTLVFEEEYRLDNAVGDAGVRKELRNNDELRTEYLVLCDIAKTLVDIAQNKFSQLATQAPHFSQYFKSVMGDAEIGFDFSSLKNVYKSFIDSIVIELCLPESSMPKYIFTRILEEAVLESPAEAKRFPQAMWDALGDLSIAIKFEEILQGPLRSLEGEQWLKQEREKPQEFDQWLYAQDVSAWVCENFGDEFSIMFPLEKTRYQPIVSQIWDTINKSYEEVVGATPEKLWGLEGQIKRQSKWHALPPTKEQSIIRPAKGAKPKPVKKTLAITDGNDSDGSMPSLETVSDSSDNDEDDDDEDDLWESGSEQEYQEEDDDDDESGYDTDEEEELKAMLRDAMESAARTDSEYLNPGKEFDISQLEQEKKGNPFIKLLGSLRGRLFSSSPNLQTKESAAPRATKFTPPPRPAGAAKAPKMTIPKTAPSQKAPTQGPQTNRNVTVEEVEDEGEDNAGAKKKKKKKPKKKKKATTGAEESVDSPTTEAPASPTPPPVTPSPVTSPKPTPASPTTKKQAPKSTSTTKLPNASTASLPSFADLTRQQTAQSAHSYMQNEQPAEPKVKAKSRPDFGNLLSISEDSGKRRIFDIRSKKQDTKAEDKDNKQSLYKFFSRLKKNTKEYMHQLLGSPEDEKQGKAGMKWENFLKVMREMGFEYDPSTAGSSVRFDPPDKKDKPITFHKPHPDSWIYPVMLKDFGKRLQKQYGWSELYFAKPGA